MFISFSLVDCLHKWGIDNHSTRKRKCLKWYYILSWEETLPSNEWHVFELHLTRMVLTVLNTGSKKGFVNEAHVVFLAQRTVASTIQKWSPFWESIFWIVIAKHWSGKCCYGQCQFTVFSLKRCHLPQVRKVILSCECKQGHFIITVQLNGELPELMNKRKHKPVGNQFDLTKQLRLLVCHCKFNPLQPLWSQRKDSTKVRLDDIEELFHAGTDLASENCRRGWAHMETIKTNH